MRKLLYIGGDYITVQEGDTEYNVGIDEFNEIFVINKKI